MKGHQYSSMPLFTGIVEYVTYNVVFPLDIFNEEIYLYFQNHNTNILGISC